MPESGQPEIEFTNIGNKEELYPIGEISVTSLIQEGKSIILQIGNHQMEVNGQIQEIDPGNGTVPIIVAGRTLLPISAVVEALGRTVSWEGEQKRITVEAGGKIIFLWIGENKILVNGQNIPIDVAPTIINERTMVPLRVIAESLNCKVVWDGYNRKVTIKLTE